MDQIASYIKTFIGQLGGLGGGLGLFFVAFCDSSFVSLPEINDILIFYLCTRYKERAWYFILMATLGSTAGCLALYSLGKWKGYRFLKRRYSDARLSRTLSVFQRYGMLAVIGPALMPPPFPFKIFVLSAGICGLSFTRFTAAVLIGRGFRYTVEGAMAVHYGDRALDYFHENYPELALLVVGALLAVALPYLMISGLRRRREDALLRRRFGSNSDTG